MSELGCNDAQKDRDGRVEPLGENSITITDKDLIMEEILANINSTPIGQVLKKIASLPEVRRDKVLDVRRQLTEGRYEINERLSSALDKVLEDLTA